jgi:RNA polymerase sigma-70 factor (ECF subfamily)
MMMHLTANPLVSALAGGRPEGYAQLYDRHGRSMLRVARVMLGDSLEAEDAVQDVFVELVRRRDRLAHVRDLEAYLFAMLRHAVIRRMRRRRNEQRHVRQWTPATSRDADGEASDDLARALDLLPAEQREVIALKIDGGLTFARIGEVLKLSPHTAASRYRYALAKLRQTLER